MKKLFGFASVFLPAIALAAFLNIAGTGRIVTPSDPPAAIEDGGTFTINGSGFGTNVAAANQAFFGGVNGPVQQATAGVDIRGLTFPTGFVMTGTEVGSDPEFVDKTRQFENTGSSIKHRYGYTQLTGGTYTGPTVEDPMADSSNFQWGFQFDFGSGGYRSIYTKVRVYYADAGRTAGQVKFQRFTGDADGGIQDGDMPNSLFQEYATIFPANIRRLFGSSDLNTDLGSGGTTNEAWVRNGWVEHELFIVPGTAGSANGSVQWRFTNGATGAVTASGTLTGRQWLDTGDIFRWWVLQGYIANEAQWDGAEISWDRDAYAIANTSSTAFPKVVVLGDASTFAACTKRLLSIQKFTSWSDTSIDIVINKGAHSNLTGKYLYVLDGINSAVNSSGIPLASNEDFFFEALAA